MTSPVSMSDDVGGDVSAFEIVGGDSTCSIFDFSSS